MKVLMLGNLPYGEAVDGLDNHNLNLFQNLKRMDGVDVKFSSFIEGGVGWSRRQKLGYKLAYNLPLRYLLKTSTLIRTFRPDVIHLQNCSPSPYAFLFILTPFRAKRLMTIHGVSSNETKAGNYGRIPRMMSFLYRAVERAAIMKAHRIILVSEGKRNWFREEHGEAAADKSVVIRNGIDLQKIKNHLETSIKGKEVLRRFGIPSEKFVAFYAKGFVPCNGQEYMVEAMERILGVRDDIVFVLAGYGPTWNALQRLSKERGISSNVKFLGTIANSDVLSILAVADVAVVPSVKVGRVEEGLSIFLLEAMAMGRPVIVTDVGGRECVTDGITGILIPQKDAGAISDAVLRLYRDESLRASLGKNAQEEIFANWSSERMSQLIYREYKRLTLAT